MTLMRSASQLATSVDQLTGETNITKVQLDAKVALAEASVVTTQAEQIATEAVRDEAAARAADAATHLATVKAGVTYQGLSAILAEKAVTAVDVFVYNTSLDSDGGAWRKRCQHTSWYNETLNTATRGARREFPAVSLIVAETGKVTIYDGDDPTLPMWMVFGLGVGSLLTSFNSVSMRNGIMCAGSPASINFSGLLVARFLNDDAIGVRGHVYWNLHMNVPAISARNGTWQQAGSRGFLAYASPSVLVNPSVKDVAMTVLPDAPVDLDTGLPVPTIAVANDGGVSVVRNDGSVVDLVNYVSAPSQVSFVDVGGTKKIWTTSRYNNWIGLFDIPDADFNTGPYLWGFQHGGGVTWFGQRFADTNEHLVAGANNGIVLFNKDEKLTNLQGASTANRWQQMSAVIASGYTSGWLPGDVKSALLANTDATSLAASGELVTNGGFDTDADWAKGAGWTISGGVASCDGAQTATTALSQTKVLSPGTYVIEFDITAQTSGSVYIYLGATIVPSVTAIGHHVYTFTVTSTTTTLYINGSSTFVGSVDNISIQRADADRSVHNRSLIVNGTVTRTRVADGAELVGYSGFSATGDPATSNFLEQPYNSALDFGIGPFSMIWWEKKTVAATRYQFDRRGSDNSGKFTTYSDASGFLSFLAYDNNGTIIAGGTKVATVPATISAWVMQSVVRDVNGTLRLFTNGKLNGEFAFSGDITNVFADAPLVVGNRWDHMNAWEGALALLRISASAPTADQIAKIYEDERKLFQPGAQCTLYGTSDAVTALAHDPKTNLLHVGTLAGRSTFDGLVRVANTETPVTTAISAVNGLIAEQ